MRISRFIHVLNENEVWDALNKKIIELQKKQVVFIKDNKNNFDLIDYPRELEDMKIIVNDEFELKRINEIIKNTTDKQFQSLYLITTTSCNLDCDYCFYRSSSSQSLKHRENMSFETAKQAIDKFYDLVSKNEITKDYWQQITFYGGEPLINKNLLFKAIPYVKRKFKKYTTIVINTNLILLDDEIIKLFKENNVEVQVSLDGNKQQHDLHRKTIKGKGTYDVVIKNMKTLLSNGIKVLPMITATDSNIHDFSNIVYGIVKELNIDDYAVNILITNSFLTSEKYPIILANEMIKAYKDFGNEATDYSFVDLYEKILGKTNEVAKNSCGSTRKITVFPSGEVFACQALEKININRMGTIDSDFINNENWNIWRKRNRFNNEKCLNCEAIASCGGGCATGSYNCTGSIFGIDKNQCKYTKEIFNQIIKKNN